MDAAILITDTPAAITFWERHFFAVRRRFFAVHLAFGVHSALLPWMMGLLAWGDLAPAHAATVPMLVFATIGFTTTAIGVHRVLPALTIALNVLALAFSPV